MTPREDGSDERRDAFLKHPYMAVIATEAPNCRPHLAPIWFAWDGSEFTIVTPPSSRKFRHLTARPRFSLCIDKRSWPYESVIVDCELSGSHIVTGYPSWLAERYLSGRELQLLLDRYSDLKWAVVTGTPTRWYVDVGSDS